MTGVCPQAHSFDRTPSLDQVGFAQRFEDTVLELALVESCRRFGKAAAEAFGPDYEASKQAEPAPAPTPTPEQKPTKPLMRDEIAKLIFLRLLQRSQEEEQG